MIRTVAETGSTNADLIGTLRAGEALAEGHWLIADRQVSGRGRQGRHWSDGSGNFMGSTVVRPGHGDPPLQSLALVAGLALYEASVPLLADPAPLRLKWPNDLMHGEAKVAGILLEREGDTVVVGIGVNLAQAPVLPDRATGCFATWGPAPDRDLFARALAATFDREIERWRSFGLEPLIRRWEAAAHPRGTPLHAEVPGEGRVSGRFAGLSSDGALSLRLPDGSTRIVHAGDIMLASKGN